MIGLVVSVQALDMRRLRHTDTDRQTDVVIA